MLKRLRFPLLFLLVFLAYSSSLPAGLHADDWSHQWIPRTFSSFSDLWNPPFPFNTSFRPGYLAYLWGLSKVSLHSIAFARAAVIAIHLVAVWAVWLLAKRCLPAPEDKGGVIPLIAALWFGIAFCHFEVPHALTNSETPGALLVLLTLLALTQWWRKPSLARGGLALLLWALALLCKEYALWIPLGLMAWQVSAPRDRRAAWKGLGPILTAMGGISLAYLWKWMRLDRSAGDMALLLQPTISVDGIRSLVSSLISLPFLDPFQGRWYGILHDRLGLPTAVPSVGWVFMGAFFVAVLGVGWRGLNRVGRWLGLGLIFCPLVLTCWLPGDPASRHEYLPSAGFGLFLTGAVGVLRFESWKSFDEFIILFFKFESWKSLEGIEGVKKSLWGKSLALLLVGFLVLQGFGSFSVGWELSRTTRQREAITDRLTEELQEIPSETKVYLSGLPERARVNMALYFLFPGREIVDLTPSPLLKEQPIDLLRKETPPDTEAVVLEWDGLGFARREVSEFLIDAR